MVISQHSETSTDYQAAANKLSDWINNSGLHPADLFAITQSAPAGNGYVTMTVWFTPTTSSVRPPGVPVQPFSG